MGKNIFNTVKNIALVCICFFSFSVFQASAHPLLPDEVVEFIKENPNATQQDFDIFMEETYGNVPLDDLIKDDPADQPVIFGDIPEDEAQKIIEEYNLQQEQNAQYDPSFEELRDQVNLFLSVREEKPFWENAKDFVILGVEHIVFGFDHVLFVLSLVLVLAPWRKILAMVTVFTVAHSITLILAGMSILTLSAKIVEPIIALSIAYMAITSVFLRKKKFFRSQHNKLWVIFFFGLFHGLGFAGVFSDLQIPADKYLSSLLFFNGGVEIGQIAILLVAVPILSLIKEYPKVYRWVVQTLSVGISVLALFWFIERVFL